MTIALVYDYLVIKMEAKKRLLKLLYKNSFLYDPIKGFTLTSGKKSGVYFDCKKTTLTSKGMVLVGQLFWQRIKGLDIKAIGGLSLGADPIVCATVMQAAKEGEAIDAFLVRNEPKGHGTKGWLEGNIKEGIKVVIVEDVVTTGGSVLKAISKAEEAGLKVIKVIMLIDREEGGREAIETKGYECDTIFRHLDFMEFKKEAFQLKTF